MRMEKGRLKTGYFKDNEVSGLKWNGQILRATGVLSNTTWFSLDGTDRVARMANHRDIDATELVRLMGYLEGDEAVAIVAEHSITKYWGARQWNPPAWDGIGFGPQRPPGAIIGGDIGGCTLEILLEDCAAMASYLVVRGRMWILGAGAPEFGLTRVERIVDPAARAALFAGT